MSYSDLCASLAGGATAELLVLPICTVQTVYQTQKNLGEATRLSVFQTTRNLYQQYGLRAFGNASVSAMAAQMVSTGSKFTLYKALQAYRKTEAGDIKNNIINGITSGLMSIVFTQPFDVFKNYHQRQLSIIPDLKSNPMFLYRGTKQSISKSIMLGAALYPVNDLTSTYIPNSALAAFATSLIITPIIHPIDLFKRRAMAGEKLWMGLNPVNYYRGLFINLIRVTPHFTITMTTINYVKKLFD